MTASLALAGCHFGLGAVRPHTSVAVVHNAVDFGLMSATYFVVSEVDGKVVHRKYDRSATVEVAPGQRGLSVRYYAESVSQEPRGVEECRISLAAEAGRDYYLEGVVEGIQWKVRLVDAYGEGEVLCLFANNERTGTVLGGSQDHAVSSRPPIPRSAPRRPPVAVSPPNVLPAVDRSVGGPASSPATGEPSIKRGAPAPTRPRSTFVTKAMRGRGHWGCPSSLFRVSGIEDGAVGLSGSERVRLIGVEPVAGEGFATALQNWVGGCVSLELESPLAGERLRDRDGRLFGYLTDENGTLLNAEVIRLGGARVDPQSRCRRLGELLAAQAEARSTGRGTSADD